MLEGILGVDPLEQRSPDDTMRLWNNYREAAQRNNEQGAAVSIQNEDGFKMDSKGASNEDKVNLNEKYRCHTCENRRYQDGSDDPGVSFKTPSKLSPEQAASAVASHEREHVFREQSKAAQEGAEVISQSVELHTSICPECGKVYVAGGTTRTVTKNDVPSSVSRRVEGKGNFINARA